MSDYECFRCREPFHTSELYNEEWLGKESLLCLDCLREINRSYNEEENKEKK